MESNDCAGLVEIFGKLPSKLGLELGLELRVFGLTVFVITSACTQLPADLLISMSLLRKSGDIHICNLLIHPEAFRIPLAPKRYSSLVMFLPFPRPREQGYVRMPPTTVISTLRDQHQMISCSRSYWTTVVARFLSISSNSIASDNSSSRNWAFGAKPSLEISVSTAPLSSGDPRSVSSKTFSRPFVGVSTHRRDFHASFS